MTAQRSKPSRKGEKKEKGEGIVKRRHNQIGLRACFGVVKCVPLSHLLLRRATRAGNNPAILPHIKRRTDSATAGGFWRTAKLRSFCFFPRGVLKIVGPI